MGERDSDRRYILGDSRKTTVEKCKIVSIAWLNRHDYFCGQKSGQILWSHDRREPSKVDISVRTTEQDRRGCIRFQYTCIDRFSGSKTPYDCIIALDTTPCNFGGVRYWFICPLAIDGVA